MMKTDIAQITQQITFLDTRQLDELSLFIEFLISKQKKESKKKAKTESKKPMLLADMQPLAIPVSQYIIQRDSLYEDNL